MKPELEICCDNYQSAIAAEKGGADRIELCASIGEGGLTPSIGMIEQIAQNTTLGIHVLIRPRSGDFLYNDGEIEIIKKDIQACKQHRVNGIVVGFINPDGSIDTQLLKEIIDLARPLKVCFHRAFDLCSDPLKSLEELIDLGVDYLLTSGQEAKAIDGIGLISQLVQKANNRIKIMPGSGVRTHLLEDLCRKTKAPAYHMSARILMDSNMKFRKLNVAMGNDSQNKEFQTYTHDINSIKKAQTILGNLSSFISK